MKKLFISSLMLLILITGCAKKDDFCTVTEQGGITTYSNKNQTEKLDFKMQKVTEIVPADTLSGLIGQLTVSPAGEIFYLNMEKMRIQKFGADGKFISAFGRRGTGPGEYMMGAMLFLAGNDLVVGDAMQQKLVVFSLDGEFRRFIDKIPAFPADVKVLKNGRIVSSLVKPEQKPDGFYLTNAVAFLDSSYREKQTIFTTSSKLDMSNPMAAQKNFPLIAAGAAEVYLTAMTPDKYQIEVFSDSGRQIQKISRNYQKVPYSPAESALIQKKIDDNLKQYGSPIQIKFEDKFKNSITWLGCDAKNRLWVQSSVEDKTGSSKIKRFDIFENGRMNGYLEIAASGDPLLAAGKLYLIDREENKITVYSYE